MKKVLLCAFVLCAIAGSVNAAFEARGNEYQAWFDSYLARFDDCSFTLSQKDKEDLQSLLEIKPKTGSGRFYNLWFVKLFCMYIEETQPTLATNEIEKFSYVMSGIPDFQGSNQYYHFYLDYAVKSIEDFMPFLDDSERKYLDYLKRARPLAEEGDYEKWLSQYNRLKSNYGPNQSDDEKSVLRFMVDIKPSDNGNGNLVYPVKRETLLRIKYLIANGQPNSAMAEIDSILANGQGVASKP